MAANTAIVIGGGIAGCSTAHALAKRGLQVTLIERNTEIASEASGNPLAMLYPRLSGDDASSQFALAGYLYSLALFKTLNLPADDFNTCGMLQLGFNARELARIKKVAAKEYSPNILKYVTQLEASTLAGIDIAHDALYFPQAAWVNPKQLCQRLVQHKNISVITSHQVGKLIKNNAVFDVYNLHNCVIAKADIVIIANANAAQQLCPATPFGTQAISGQVSLVSATNSSSALQTIICSDGYLSPAAYHHHNNAMHCLGATFTPEPTYSPEQENKLPSYKHHLVNLAKLNNMSPQLYHDLLGNVTEGRVSYRCTASDYWPLVGQLLNSPLLITSPPRPDAAINSLPWIDGLYMNIAHGSKGFTCAPLCAELLANLIGNETPCISTELIGRLNPNRFLLNKMGLKKISKTIAYHQAATSGANDFIL